MHFDETNYSEEYYNKCGGFEAVINNEIVILKGLLDIDITCVSMHRPSKKTLEANYDLYPNKNSYGDEFFKKFKYVSDSRHRWRENITEIIDSNRYNKLHILTHAFWYNEYPEDIKTTILKFIMQSPHSRYEMIEQNIVGLSEIIEEKMCIRDRVTIEENTLIDDGVVITLGRKVGSNCIIGAGSVVTKDICNDSVAYGVPAKIIRNN